MPAATLGQLANKLSGYVSPDSEMTFSDALSQTLSRLYALGVWEDTTEERVLTVREDCTVSLPYDADSILHWLHNNAPGQPIRPLWHDYRVAGKGERPLTPGLINAGYTVGTSYLDSDTGGYSLNFETEDGTVFQATEQFVIDYTDSSGVRRKESVTPSSSVAFILTDEDDIAEVHSIVWSGISRRVRVELKNDTASLVDDSYGLLIGPEGVLRTKRFRVGGAFAGDTVRVLLKLKPPIIDEDHDVIQIGNVNALKHGLLALVAEEQGDPDLAQMHWSNSLRILNEELGSAETGTEFVINFSLPGQSPIPAIL